MQDTVDIQEEVKKEESLKTLPNLNPESTYKQEIVFKKKKARRKKGT